MNVLLALLDKVLSLLPHKTFIGAAVVVATALLRKYFPDAPWDAILAGDITLRELGNVLFGMGLFHFRLKSYLGK